MRIIKLGRGPDGLDSRNGVIAYFSETLLRKNRLGLFGVTEAKSNMPDVEAGTLLVFTFDARCMFVCRANAPMAWRRGEPFLPIRMTTVERVNVPLEELESHIGGGMNLINNRQWPQLPDEIADEIESFLRKQTPKHDAADPKRAEEELTRLMFGLYPEAGRRAGYWGRRYLSSLHRNGASATAHRMLKPRRNGKVDPGLARLQSAGLAGELSVEAIALRPDVSSLFTAEEAAEARRRLSEEKGLAKEDVPPEENFPDQDYVEGETTVVRVNRYERNPAARRDCIRHHGAVCAICDADFERRYGAMGKGFIHVHHLRELGSIRKRYKVDPVRDLLPVCPNCHAMLHSTRPARTVDEVRNSFRKGSK